MLKLKLQYFGHLMGRIDSFEKILMLGKIDSRRRRGRQKMRWLDGITDSMDMGLGGLQVPKLSWWWTGKPDMLQCTGHKELDTTERLSDWTKVALVVKNPPANAGDLRDPGFNPWIGKVPWRRAQQPTLVFLSGESHGQRSLVRYSP